MYVPAKTRCVNHRFKKKINTVKKHAKDLQISWQLHPQAIIIYFHLMLLKFKYTLIAWTTAKKYLLILGDKTICSAEVISNRQIQLGRMNWSVFGLEWHVNVRKNSSHLTDQNSLHNTKQRQLWAGCTFSCPPVFHF